MAEILLGTINITGPSYSSAYEQGDVINIYYDPEKLANSVFPEPNPRMELNGVPNIFGPPLIDSNGLPVDYQRSTNETVVTNTFATGIVSYLAVNAVNVVPYILLTPVPAPPEPGEPQDLDISLESVTRPSSNLTSDGSVSVVASGSNTPFSYGILNGDGSVSSMNSNGVFNDLPQGEYTFAAQDSAGNIDTLSVSLIALEEAPVLRWYAEFYDDFVEGGGLYRVEIFERGFIGVSEEITVLPQGDASLNYRSENKEYYDTFIIPSNVVVQINATIEDQYKDLILADEKQFTLKKYYEGDLVWQGFFNPGSYSDQLYTTPYSVSMVFADRLADLKNYDFSYTDEYNPDTGEGAIKGNISQIEAIRICLSKIDLGLGMRIGINLFAENHNTTNTTPLHQTYFDASIYIDDNKVENCYTVLEDILRVYQAIIYSADGYWYIVRKQEYLNIFNSVYTLPPAEQVDPPENLVATAINSSEINLTWDYTGDLGEVSGFNIDRSDDNINWTSIDVVSNSTTEYNDIGLLETTLYYYRVNALAIPPDLDSDYSNVASAETLQFGLIDLFGSNLHAWFTSENVILNGVNQVSQMTDMSGNERHMVQPIGNNQPIVLTGGIEGYDRINFNSANYRLSNNDWGIGTDDYFILTVTFMFNQASRKVYWSNSEDTGFSVNDVTHSYIVGGSGRISRAALNKNLNYYERTSAAGFYTQMMAISYATSERSQYWNGVLQTNNDDVTGSTVPLNEFTLGNSSELGGGGAGGQTSLYEFAVIKGKPSDYGLSADNAYNDAHTLYFAPKYPSLSIVNPNLP